MSPSSVFTREKKLKDKNVQNIIKMSSRCFWALFESDYDDTKKKTVFEYSFFMCEQYLRHMAAAATHLLHAFIKHYLKWSWKVFLSWVGYYRVPPMW